MTASMNTQSEKASILLIYTGGTIGMIETPKQVCWNHSISNI